MALAVWMLSGCRTSRQATPGKQAAVSCLSSKLRLTVPDKSGATLTVNGTLKLRSGERVQVSLLMPILRTEVARVELTPDTLLMVDRMGKRYVRIDRSQLRGLLPRDADFAHLQKMLFKASRPGADRTLTGADLGLAGLEKAQVELYDFSDKAIALPPTELSSRYREVPPEELLELLLSL